MWPSVVVVTTDIVFVVMVDVSGSGLGCFS